MPTTKKHSYVGLDFGTSTTLLADVPGIDNFRVLPLGRATSWLPSAAGKGTPQSDLLVGDDALALPPTQVIRSVKRSITTGLETVTITIDGKKVALSADEIASAIVKKAIQQAKKDERFAGIKHVRAGCPAMWDADQRDRLRNILHNAGIDLQTSDVVDEPIAAALAWVTETGRNAKQRFEGRLVVFDYGGGTLDVAVCLVRWHGDVPDVTVLSCEGVSNAGDDLDDLLHKYVVETHFSEEDGPELTLAQRAAIQNAVREAKEYLSFNESHVLPLKSFGLKDVALSREELEREFRPLLDTAIGYLMFALRGAELRNQRYDESVHVTDESLRKAVDRLLLVGGMSQIPLVRTRMEQLGLNVASVSTSSGQRIRGPQELVVAGLVQDPEQFAQLNLHRPSFDISVEWTIANGQVHSELLYRAHTPLYRFGDYRSKRSLGFERSFQMPSTRGISAAQLVLTTTDGEKLPIRMVWKETEVSATGLSHEVEKSEELEAIRLGAQERDVVRVKLYVDGRILLSVNGAAFHYRGSSGVLYLNHWPMIRAGNYPRRAIEFSTGPRHLFPAPSHPQKY